MKTLVVLCAVVAVAVAKPGFLGGAGHLGGAGLLGAGYAGYGGFAGFAGPLGYAGAGHGGVHPGLAAYGPAKIVIGPGGVPLDTPEVAAAKGAHAAAVAETRARDAAINGHAYAAAPVGPVGPVGLAGHGLGHGLGGLGYLGGHGYHG